MTARPPFFSFCRFFFFSKKVEVLEYPELGMEAVWKIDVENFPAFIVVDGKGDRAAPNLPHTRCLMPVRLEVKLWEAYIIYRKTVVKL